MANAEMATAEWQMANGKWQMLTARLARNTMRIAATLLIACSLGAGAQAAETNHSWHALAVSVTPPRVLSVTLFTKETIEGPIVAIDDNAITLQTDHGPRRIAGGDVRQVRDLKRERRRLITGILAGAAIGAGVTTAVDQGSSHPSSKKEAATIGALLIGAPAGAVVGRMMRGRPLYEAGTRRGP